VYVDSIANKLKVIKGLPKIIQIAFVYFRGFDFFDDIEIDKGIKKFERSDVVGR
jgi:hypothetical protein